MRCGRKVQSEAQGWRVLAAWQAEAQSETLLPNAYTNSDPCPLNSRPFKTHLKELMRICLGYGKHSAHPVLVGHPIQLVSHIDQLHAQSQVHGFIGFAWGFFKVFLRVLGDSFFWGGGRFFWGLVS